MFIACSYWCSNSICQFFVKICQDFQVFCHFPLLKFPFFTDHECSRTQGHNPLLPTIPLFHAQFHEKTCHQLDLGGISAYPWLCHEVEILSSTCAGIRPVRASGRLPSHPLSLYSSARWTAWLTHLKVQAKGFCCWIYSSFYKLSSFFFFFYITGKDNGYVTHISTCCFIYCQQKGSWGKKKEKKKRKKRGTD